MKNSSYYKSYAKECLSGNWGAAILVSFVAVIASSILGLIPAVGIVISFILAGQFAVGAFNFYTKLVKKEDVKFVDMFKNFDKFLDSFKTYFLQMLFIFLWSLLLLVPGIIATYSYSMTLFLKQKNPEMKAKEAIQLSSQIMKGKKWKLFCLEFSFIGWILLGIITFGIGLIYVIPYMQAAITRFFEDAYNDYFNIEDKIEIELN